MARRKFRLTGFARFFLFLLIVTPLAFFGVTWWKTGQVPQSVNDIKSALTTEQTATAPAPATAQTQPSDCAELEKEIADLERRLLRKNREIEDLRAEIERLKE
ncbi:MAG: hypothetical protein D6714_08780 [Bacteroidetes bacterium]|nr:MAG: hypothetical protein D6714_08780 [Bacteroidota bacterium]